MLLFGLFLFVTSPLLKVHFSLSWLGFFLFFFRAGELLKAADAVCSQFRSCHSQQGILQRHLFLDKLPQTLQHEVSPFTRSRSWRKARGEVLKSRESDSSWLHLHFSVNFSWHEASEEEPRDRWRDGGRSCVRVQNVFSHYFGSVCIDALEGLWHHYRPKLEWWQCQAERRRTCLHTPKGLQQGTLQQGCI